MAQYASSVTRMKPEQIWFASGFCECVYFFRQELTGPTVLVKGLSEIVPTLALLLNKLKYYRF